MSLSISHFSMSVAYNVKWTEKYTSKGIGSADIWPTFAWHGSARCIHPLTYYQSTFIAFGKDHSRKARCLSFNAMIAGLEGHSDIPVQSHLQGLTMFGLSNSIILQRTLAAIDFSGWHCQQAQTNELTDEIGLVNIYRAGDFYLNVHTRRKPMNAI